MSDVNCGNCGAALDEPGNIAPENRSPCPHCGSTTRTYAVSATASVRAVASFSAEVSYGDISSHAELLLKGVIVAGERTPEGTLIEAVATPWFDIIDLLHKNPQLIHEIPWEKWEEIIAGAYSKAGFEEVTLTPRSGDYGRDVIATKRAVGTIRVIDSVKAYKPGHLVEADDVRALWGVMQGDRASKGFVTTTSDFAPRIVDDPFIKEFIPARLELINGQMLLERLQALARRS